MLDYDDVYQLASVDESEVKKKARLKKERMKVGSPKDKTYLNKQRKVNPLATRNTKPVQSRRTMHK